MTANIIIDAVRPKPNATLGNELVSQGIRFVLWDAIHEPDSVVRSINQSHKRIVQFAKDHNMPEVCIMEEDVMFTAPGAWQYYLDNKPEKFDLYLGGAYGLDGDILEQLITANGPIKIHSFTGLHCYIISELYYDKFLHIPIDQHIDHQDGMGQFYIVGPMVALQHPGWSSNNRDEVNYNVNMDKYLYYGQG